MSHSTDPSTKTGTRKALLSIEQCRSIAAEFDGRSETIDRLLTEWHRIVPGLKRHNLIAAARRGGYVAKTTRQRWTVQEDQFIRANWHLLSADEVAAQLGRTFDSVKLRSKRLGVRRYEGDELTVRDLEDLTGINHRQWHKFIDQGWLVARRRERRHGAAPVTYVSLGGLHRLLIDHPEIYDHRAAPGSTRALLELGRLPPAPKWKRVVCQSDAWETRPLLPSEGGAAEPAGQRLDANERGGRLQSCAGQGGTAFWAPLYAAPTCPRCGCQVSRYAPDGVFTDIDPGNDERIAVQAAKVGLRWTGEQLVDSSGQPVADAEVMAAVFDGQRNSSRSIRTFGALLQAGLSLLPSQGVPSTGLLENILELTLRPDQEEALQSFVSAGAITAGHAMSFGKSTVGLMAMSRLAGDHLLFVDSELNREQWLEKLARLAPAVAARRLSRPSRVEVDVYDRLGAVRCTIHIYNYQTRATLDREWVVAVFDEVHRLPARRAHRHAFVHARYRLGLSATAELRSDGRGAFISKITGAIVGADWDAQMQAGMVPRIPVKVIVVQDREHKHEVVGQLLAQHERVTVLCESLADGKEIEDRYGIPFVHGGTPNKLAVVRSARSLVLSRVGDSGLSVPECEVTVDHSGLFGSRIQSLQRLGRLMHSKRAKFHCILMTHEERHERFAARVEAIRGKGFPVEETVAERKSAAVRHIATADLGERVSAQDNPFTSLLGWRRDDLSQAA